MRDDPRLRFRVWIDGTLIDESWINVDDADRDRAFADIMGEHMIIVEKAIHNGLPWLIECYDPAKPHEQAYMRIGTDSDGMVSPIQLPWA